MQDEDAMKAMIDELEAQDAQDTLDRAIAWTVVSVDREFPEHRLVMGVFRDPVEACVFANRHSEEVHDSIDPADDGWDIVVEAIMPADGHEPSFRDWEDKALTAMKSDARLVLLGILWLILLVSILRQVL